MSIKKAKINNIQEVIFIDFKCPYCERDVEIEELISAMDFNYINVVCPICKKNVRINFKEYYE